MTTPGVGPVVAPDLFAHKLRVPAGSEIQVRSGAVCLGYVPRYQAGEIRLELAKIRACGDGIDADDALPKQSEHDAFKKWSWLSARAAMRSPGRRGIKKAIVGSWLPAGRDPCTASG